MYGAVYYFLFCLVRLVLGLSYFFLIFLGVRIRIIFVFQPIRFD